MMIQRSIAVIFLISTCFQSFTMVQAMEPEDAAPFMAPFDRLASVIPEGGSNGLVTGVVPDAEKLIAGLAKRSDEAMTTESPQTEGTGVATYSDGPNEGGALQGLSKDLLSQLKKRYRAINSNGESELNDGAVKEHTKTLVALLSRRSDLGISELLGGSNSNDAGMDRSGSTGGGLLGGLRRRSLGLLSGDASRDETSERGTSVSLIGGGLSRRKVDQEGNDSAYEQQKTSSGGGGSTKVSLLDLRRRQILGGLLGGQSQSAAQEPGNQVSLLGKRDSTAAEGVTTGGAGDLGEPLDRRSTTSVLSGAERMDRARQGVVMDSQSKSGMVDRRAVYAARDYDDDRRTIEDYQKLMDERQEENNYGLQTPSSEQAKKGTTKVSLLNLKRRLVNNVVENLTEKLALGGTEGQASQSNGDLISDVTSTIQ